MSYISSRTGKLHQKKETKRLKTFPAGYVGIFYWDLANIVDSATTSDFYSRIANDVDVQSEDIQKYFLAISDFFKGMETDINHYVTRDRLNNASFRQTIDSIAKNIFWRQNPLKLVFEDISTFDTHNPIVGWFLRDLDIGKKIFSERAYSKSSQVRRRFRYTKKIRGVAKRQQQTWQ